MVSSNYPQRVLCPVLIFRRMHGRSFFRWFAKAVDQASGENYRIVGCTCCQCSPPPAVGLSATMQVYQFSSLGPDGSAIGRPVPVASWENPRLFTQSDPHEYDRVLVYRKAQIGSGWEMAVPMPLSTGDSFIVLWASWIDANDPTRKSLSSSWKRWLRRAAQSGRRRKYKPHYPVGLPTGKAIEPFMYRRH